MSSKLTSLEDKLIHSGNHMAQKVTAAAISAFTDYKHRHLGIRAASVSFFVIFSAFPLLAFCVYLVGQMVGDANPSVSAPMVLQMLRDFVPGMQKWIEKGLFDVIRGNSVTSWVNAVLLGWSGLGLFSALLSAMESLDDHHKHRAHMTHILLAILTLSIFAVFISTIVFTRMAVKSDQIPFWLQGVPDGVQKALFFLARTKILLIAVSIGCVASTYKFLSPIKLTIRSAVAGALMFTSLLFLSRSAYWIYLHYNQQSIQSTYGVFSALILIMLWVHFCVNCLMYSCLFSIHFDRMSGVASSSNSHQDHSHAA